MITEVIWQLIEIKGTFQTMVWNPSLIGEKEEEILNINCESLIEGCLV